MIPIDTYSVLASNVTGIDFYAALGFLIGGGVIFGLAMFDLLREGR